MKKVAITSFVALGIVIGYLLNFAVSAIDFKASSPKNKITLYAADGKEINHWYSDQDFGFYSESDSGPSFREYQTNNWIRIQGTVVIEKVDSNEVIHISSYKDTDIGSHKRSYKDLMSAFAQVETTEERQKLYKEIIRLEKEMSKLK